MFCLLFTFAICIDVDPNTHNDNTMNVRDGVYLEYNPNGFEVTIGDTVHKYKYKLTNKRFYLTDVNTPFTQTDHKNVLFYLPSPSVVSRDVFATYVQRVFTWHLRSDIDEYCFAHSDCQRSHPYYDPHEISQGNDFNSQQYFYKGMFTKPTCISNDGTSIEDYNWCELPYKTNYDGTPRCVNDVETCQLVNGKPTTDVEINDDFIDINYEFIYYKQLVNIKEPNGASTTDYYNIFEHYIADIHNLWIIELLYKYIYHLPFGGFITGREYEKITTFAPRADPMSPYRPGFAFNNIESLATKEGLNYVKLDKFNTNTQNIYPPYDEQGYITEVTARNMEFYYLQYKDENGKDMYPWELICSRNGGCDVNELCPKQDENNNNNNANNNCNLNPPTPERIETTITITEINNAGLVVGLVLFVLALIAFIVVLVMYIKLKRSIENDDKDDKDVDGNKNLP